jgi:shikimate dehydrogenase
MDEPKVFALLGYPLGHSFSQKFFQEKFRQLKLDNHQFHLFEKKDPNRISEVFEISHLQGFTITIPYKQAIIPLLNDLDESAKKVGAVNVVKKTSSGWVGFNSDYFGFKKSLLQFLNGHKPEKALILGTGGASKAVAAALRDLGIGYGFVSRHEKDGLTYIALKQQENWAASYPLIVNCTPLGTFPKIDEAPDLDYSALKPSNYLFDLVYNPPETLFMKKGLEMGASVINGLDMLHYQAEKAWEIWNS